MIKLRRHAGLVALASSLVATGALAAVPAGDQITGAKCASPPALHCPDTDCSNDLIANLGNAVEPISGRKFFLDYPCDLKPGEKVTFVLALHGGGSIGNWQRHYFPIMDLKEKYRLVIATPSGTRQGWSPAQDDQYLQNIVNLVYDKFGKDNIKAFWLAGHSLGGQTANRLLMTDFYRQRLTGWVSLSGGRLGSKREDVRAPIPSSAPPPGPPPSGAAGGPPRPLGLVADASILPDYNFSHIYVTGEHELTATGLPGNSLWAQKLKCGPQTRGRDIVDTKAGYVYDTRVQTNPSPIWGGKARPGTAHLFVYPACADGRVVADIVRMDKGHTEGYEPHETEAIVKLMMAAR
jgi:pimeloyl-ACP methyl ester carboxylesterase